ncbi:MAG: LytTr DNA-binding region [Gemmatimonadetes bacterium]|nr:LytTr DNA-binding region [Gemmatimonadota bacterium]
MLTVIIVDDEELARARMRRLLSSEQDAELVAEYDNGAEALEGIREHAPDVVFLDVEMPEIDGIAVAEQLAADAHVPMIVFATAFDRYAVRAFEVSAMDYLLKPVNEERFAQAWAKLRERAAAGAPGEAQRLLAALAQIQAGDETGKRAGSRSLYRIRFMVPETDKTVLVRAEDVQWIEAAGNYVRLHTAQGNRLIRESLASLDAELDPTRFARIHRRAIVNLNCIKEIRPWISGDGIVLLQTGEKLRLSRTYRRAFDSRLEGLPVPA